jgi:hypothetical protein
MSLTIDYRPSQPHGWLGGDKPLGVTIGGHTAAAEFTSGERRYRVSLLPPDPVHLTAPSDQFRQTLDAGFGTHYAFRFPRRSVPLRVQSYSVAVTPPRFGADLYVAHAPSSRRGTVRWLQVSRSTGSLGLPSDPAPRVDGMGPANPFYPTGGSTSVHGTRVGNLTYAIEAPVGAPALDFQFAAEAFLACDTGTKDAAGREIVEVLCGVGYGWEVRS